MKVKLRIPACNEVRQYEVGEEVDFADPNQAIALVRAGQADVVADVPFPETPEERDERVKAEAQKHQEDADRMRALMDDARAKTEGETKPPIPPLSTSTPGVGGSVSGGSASTTSPTPSKPAPIPARPVPAPVTPAKPAPGHPAPVTPVTKP